MVGTGRPEKTINWQLFEELCAIHCTQGEIANILHVHPDTLRDKAVKHYDEPYSTVYNRYMAPGKMSLRRIQFNLAKKSAAMAIWLGKHWLEQKDDMTIVTATPEAQQQLNELVTKLSSLQRNKNNYKGGDWSADSTSPERSLKSA